MFATNSSELTRKGTTKRVPILTDPVVPCIAYARRRAMEVHHPS